MKTNPLPYTSDGKHPDDAIYDTKQFINELQKVQESYFNKLVKELNLTEDGESWLFDYIFNAAEDEKYLSFEEYLSFYHKTIKQFINTNK